MQRGFDIGHSLPMRGGLHRLHQASHEQHRRLRRQKLLRRQLAKIQAHLILHVGVGEDYARFATTARYTQRALLIDVQAPTGVNSSAIKSFLEGSDLRISYSCIGAILGAGLIVLILLPSRACLPQMMHRSPPMPMDGSRTTTAALAFLIGATTSGFGPLRRTFVLARPPFPSQSQPCDGCSKTWGKCDGIRTTGRNRLVR